MWLRAITVVLLFAGNALAQSAPDAETLKHKGDALLVERRYDEALVAYDQAFALSPNPAIHFNRARALQFLARFPEALASLERFEAESTPELRAKVPGLNELFSDLRAKVATITVANGVDGSRLLVGGRDAGRLPLGAPLRVNAGKTAIEILADGYFPHRFEIELPGDRTTAIDGRLVPREALRPMIVIQTTIVPEKPVPITSRWWFWAGIGAAAVTGIVVVSIVAATSEGSAPTGDFSPGQVRF